MNSLLSLYFRKLKTFHLQIRVEKTRSCNPLGPAVKPVSLYIYIKKILSILMKVLKINTTSDQLVA